MHVASWGREAQPRVSLIVAGMLRGHGVWKEPRPPVGRQLCDHMLDHGSDGRSRATSAGKRLRSWSGLQRDPFNGSEE